MLRQCDPATAAKHGDRPTNRPGAANWRRAADQGRRPLQEAPTPQAIPNVVNYAARVPYPVSVETAAAIRAAADRFVLPWPFVRTRYIDAWVREHHQDPGEAVLLPGGVPSYNGRPESARALFANEESFRRFARGEDFHHGLTEVRDDEFEAACDRVAVGMEKLAADAQVAGGRCLLLECLPFAAWWLKLAPLPDGVWVDRHMLELAEGGRAAGGARVHATASRRPAPVGLGSLLPARRRRRPVAGDG